MNETLITATHYVAAQETSCPEFFTTWALTAVPATLATCIHGACIIQAKSNRSGSLKELRNFELTWKSLVQTSLWDWGRLHCPSYVPRPSLNGFEVRSFTVVALVPDSNVLQRSILETCLQPTNYFLSFDLTLNARSMSLAHLTSSSLNVKSTSTSELTHSSALWIIGPLDNDVLSTLKADYPLTVSILQSRLTANVANILAGDAYRWLDVLRERSQSLGRDWPTPTKRGYYVLLPD